MPDEQQGRLEEHQAWSAELAARHQALISESRQIVEQTKGAQEQLNSVREQLLDNRRLHLAALNLMEDATEERRRSRQETADRKKAQELLRESEEQFRIAFEAAPIPVILQAEDGQVLQINRSWTELTGFTLAEMPNFEDWLQRAGGPGADLVRKQMHSAFNGEARAEEVDFEIISRDGERRCWVFTTSAPGRLRDGRRFAVGMALDITARKAAEEALARSEERLRLVVENAREFAIFSTDLDRRVTMWNSGAQHILGYTTDEIMGQSADVIFTEEDRAAGACEREAKTALAEGKAADERWHCRKNGETFWGNGVLMVKRGHHGKTIGFVKILRDQTREKQVEEQILESRRVLEAAFRETDRARKEAEAANKTKDIFLAALSHELRTPLTPVLMAVESLLPRKDLPPRVREALEMIHRNIEIETHFIDDLLDVTRITHGKLQLADEPVDIHESLRRAIEVSDPDIQEKEQQLAVDLSAKASRAKGDSARLQQVFWNLLKNASKFTANGGRIQVSSRNDGPGWIVVEVSDNGRGIDPSRLSDIFEAFRQEDTTITRKFGGLGLGLAIAKATVAGHGGTIMAASDGKGKGATFTVRLPVERMN